MEEQYIGELQKYATDILKKGNQGKPLWMLSKWNCSEVSRIVGLKVLSDLGVSSKPFILKGNVTVTGLIEENNHDILGFFDSGSNMYILIDPTIWQFFPKMKKIFLGKFSSVDDILKFVSEYYRGDWKVSEEVDPTLEKEVADYYKIIKLNCDQSPNWE
ncbi:MAG: hypothetical protein Q7S53_02175 [bacterium]|nr:hypothetical protein [bacterium]